MLRQPTQLLQLAWRLPDALPLLRGRGRTFITFHYVPVFYVAVKWATLYSANACERVLRSHLKLGDGELQQGVGLESHNATSYHPPQQPNYDDAGDQLPGPGGVYAVLLPTSTQYLHSSVTCRLELDAVVVSIRATIIIMTLIRCR